MTESQFHRVAERERATLTLYLDGQAIEARRGDTVLTALLLARHVIRESEFGDGPRAGFCLMGACQDCWVFLEMGGRVRACTTPAEDGLRLVSKVAVP